MNSFALIIPTLNAEKDLAALLPRIQGQTAKPKKFVVIDSESTDATREVATAAGAHVIQIARSSFNHGGTRTLALKEVRDIPVTVFLTQDALPHNEAAFSHLVRAFDAHDVDAAYGRQIGRTGAGRIEAFARHFNYPATSEIRSEINIPKLGIKTCFTSNSFAAYRTRRLIEVGGFRSDVILGEDVLAVADLLRGGGKLAYVAEAIVEHSHGYTLQEEFRRYFDIGAMHEQARETLEKYGTPYGTGAQYYRHELQHIMASEPTMLPESILRTLLKLIGYKLGRSESMLPPRLKRRLSMHSYFWK